MAGENSGTDNPLSQGSDPHSVETAAADFSAMLADEGGERPIRREREKPATRSPEPEGDDDAAERPKRQPAKREREEPSEGQDDDDRRDRTSERDPILDGDTPPKDKGEGEDDDNPEDEDESEGDDDTETDDEDEGDDQEDDFLDAKHTVTVNGKEVEVSGREALNGYMRQADYTQGTERNAREYQEIEAFAAQSVEHRDHALDLASRATALVQALQPSAEDMAWLKANKPEDFIKATEHWNGILAKAAELYQGRNTLAEGAGAQQQTRDAKYFEAQERKLVERLPALRDPKKAEHFRSAIMAYGKEAGYTEEELRTGAVDHRDLITLYKAAKYDESQRSIREAGKRAGRQDPKPSQGGKARAPGKGGNRSAQRNADRRHQRSGSVQSAAESFAEMVRGEFR